VSDDQEEGREESERRAQSAQPDDAPMHVHTAQLPDGRYCLLFTFDNDDTRE
jgi:hypothetical protein